MKTILQIELDHKRPLPENVTDAIAQRAYMFLYSNGCEAGVRATLLTATAQDHGQVQEAHE